MSKLNKNFFDRDSIEVAKSLLGKVIRVKHGNIWLSAMIIETEAYYLHDKASHASLGYTQKRSALFMPAGTIYMYYARGGDSLNISCRGEGNAVLIKSGYPYIKDLSGSAAKRMLACMQRLHRERKKNMQGENTKERAINKLCSGQTLLCLALNLKVNVWDQKQFNKNKFYFDNVNYCPAKIIQTKRLGIPIGRDEHLLYRFIDHEHAQNCTANPLFKKCWKEGKDYLILTKN